jgi:nucleotide-binding universal stress UspA family protein
MSTSRSCLVRFTDWSEKMALESRLWSKFFGGVHTPDRGSAISLHMENVTLPHLKRVSCRFRIKARREREFAEREMQLYSVRSLSRDLEISKFSGGNQQKLVIARALRQKSRRRALAWTDLAPRRPERRQRMTSTQDNDRVLGPQREAGPLVVVIGVDGSDRSWRCAAYAVGLARRTRGTYRLVFCFVATPPGRFALVPQATSLVAATNTKTATEIRATLDGALTDPGLAWEFHVRSGAPYTQLAKLAGEAHADSVIVGASETFGHRVAGSVAIRLAKARRWPVTVVP